MAKGKLNIGNLDPCRDTETAKARGKQGGIKSGEAKRKAKMIREIYADFLLKKYEVVIDGHKKNLTGSQICLESLPKIMLKADASSATLLKDIDRVQMEDLERNRVTDNELKIIIDDEGSDASKYE